MTELSQKINGTGAAPKAFALFEIVAPSA
jgi:hypothetical protein